MNLKLIVEITIPDDQDPVEWAQGLSNILFAHDWPLPNVSILDGTPITEEQAKQMIQKH